MNKFFIPILCLFSTFKIIAQPLGDQKAIVYALDVQPESKSLVALVGNRKKIEVWNYETRQLKKSWQLDQVAYHVAMVGNHVAVAVEGGIVEFYDTISFTKNSSHQVSDARISALKKLTDGIMVADSKGNVYKFSSDGPTITFKKLFMSPDQVFDLHIIPEKNIVLTGNNDGMVSLWSLSDGILIKQQQLGNHNCVSIASNSLNLITILFDHGTAKSYKINQNYELLLSSDVNIAKGLVSMDCMDNILAVGSTSGLIEIYTNLVTYKISENAMINFIRFIPTGTNYIKVAIGTQGLGIRIINATEMKMKKN